jgi:hypothetical protein
MTNDESMTNERMSKELKFPELLGDFRVKVRRFFE